MNIYGHIIKFERIKQNMKQVTLAEGICQPSYLSKIENNSIKPSDEVLGKLLIRLSLKTSAMEIPESKFIDNMKRNYKEAILYKDRAKTSLLLNELNQKQYIFKDITNFYDYQLMLLRLNLIAHDIQFSTKEIMRALSELKGHFTHQQMFTYNINVGFLSYMENGLEFSLESFQKALKILPHIKCEDWEIADMEYAIGIVYLVLHRYVSSIEYTKRSINFFEKYLYHTRSIEAYIVLSIAYKNSQKYEEALNILKKAQKVSMNANHTEHLLHLYYTIGAIDSKQGKTKSAISNFQLCIKHSNEDLYTASSIVSIIIEFAKQSDYASVLEWCQKGVEFCNNSTDPAIKVRKPHFICFQAKFGDIENYEITLLKSIKLFEQQKDFRYSHKYSLQLSQYYVENKKYKKAALQFKKTNEYLALKENRKFIEDL